MTVRFILATAAFLLASGCIDLQPTYDNAARAQCREITNQSDRQECLARVAENSRIQREEQRRRH
jgi:hypothetical protein